MKRMVVGFVFSPAGKGVLLMRKSHPDWQQGRYNGIGGHVEDEESYLAAMLREAEEETGLCGGSWEVFALLTEVHTQWEVAFLRSFATPQALYEAVEFASRQEEQVAVFEVDRLPNKCVTNLHWLIPLALDWDLTGVAKIIHR
jgi:8-oxo-dGTP diphosphatase